MSNMNIEIRAVVDPAIQKTIAKLAELAAIVQLSIGDYAPIRYAYKMEIEGAINEYLYSDNVRIVRFRNNFKKAISMAFRDAFAQGFADGGGGTYPDDAEEGTTEWLGAVIEAEFGYVDELFYRLRDLKKEGKDDPTVLQDEAAARSEGYAKTLDGIYSQGKIRGAKNKMLTFTGPDGLESCPDCQRLKGKRHKASWWVNHDLIPYRGNKNLKCGGFQCQHYLFSDDGKVYTV